MQTKTNMSLADVLAGRADIEDLPGFFHCPHAVDTVISKATCKAYQNREVMKHWGRAAQAIDRILCPDECPRLMVKGQKSGVALRPKHLKGLKHLDTE